MSPIAIARRWEALALAGLVAAFLVLTFAAVPRKSASFDEQYHLTSGYAYLKTGDYRLATTHPPLVGLLAALPLLADGSIVLPLDHPTWEQGNRYDFSDHFLWYANANGPQLVQRARGPVILLGVLMLLAVYFWARALLGPAAALLAAALAAFDPNLLANSRQVTTDLGVTLFVFLAFWQLWRWLERGGWWNLVWAGLAAGAAMGAKYSGLLLWPGVVLVLMLHPQAQGESKPWLRRAGALAAMGALSIAALWALYRFSYGPASLGGVSVPLPASFYWTHLWGTLGGLLEEGAWKPDFLLGQVSAEGWWYYFPVAIAVKTPLPTLLLLLAGLAALARFGGWRRQAGVWAPALLFLALALTGLLTIGYRHLLPALPFACILAANSLAWVERAARPARRRRGAAVGLLAAWLAASAIWFFPHHDSYFNELAGRWQNWSNLLVDSNLDWGQDLPALRDVMAENGIERVDLAYFGKSPPEAYGVAYSPLPGYLRFMGGREPAAHNPVTPAPGWYAVSATSLRLGTLRPDTVGLYAWFREREPDLRAGYSIYLYDVASGAEPAEDMVVVSAPVWRSAAVLEAGRPVRARWVQSEATQVIPADRFAGPDSQDYHHLGADFGGVFTLLGYTIDPAQPQPGDLLRLVLYWQRGAALMPMPAPTRGDPLSAFVHLTTDDAGDVRAQFDGWEAALRGLQLGDVVVQPAELALPPELPAGAYHLRAGLYSPQSWERLSVETDSGVQNSIELQIVPVQP